MRNTSFMFNSYIRRSVPNNDRILLRFVRRREVSKIQVNVIQSECNSIDLRYMDFKIRISENMR